MHIQYEKINGQLQQYLTQGDHDIFKHHHNNKINLFVFRYCDSLVLGINNELNSVINIKEDKYTVCFDKKDIETFRLGLIHISYVLESELTPLELMMFDKDDAIRHNLVELFKQEFPGYDIKLSRTWNDAIEKS